MHYEGMEEVVFPRFAEMMIVYSEMNKHKSLVKKKGAL